MNISKDQKQQDQQKWQSLCLGMGNSEHQSESDLKKTIPGEHTT